MAKKLKDRIVKRNLEKMLSTSKGGMASLLGTESIGGNASTYNGLPCIAANFVYDTVTGEILYFGNHQGIPSGIGGAQAIFRIALNAEDGSEKIVDCYCINENRDHIKKLRKLNYDSEFVRKILKETVEAYNQAKRNSA